MAQLMPLPLTVSCFSKIQIGFTFLVPALLSSPGKRAIMRACMRACVTMLSKVCYATGCQMSRKLNKEHGFLIGIRRQLQQQAAELGLPPVTCTGNNNYNK